MKTGVLGGTFDPVHLGHLMIADEAMESAGLSEVIFVPAGQPLLKPAQPMAPAEHRLKMLRLAIADRQDFRVSAMEIERPGPSYTVDTMAALASQYRGSELFFILGWDTLKQLPDWHQPSRIIEMCRLVGVPRPGCEKPDLEALEAEIPGISRRVIFLEKPLVDISASDIREMAARGMSLSQHVPRAVEDYIKQNRLYTEK